MRFIYLFIIMLLSVFLSWLHTEAGEESNKLMIADMTSEKNVESGAPFSRWMSTKNWESPLGDPKYFFIDNGRLHLVSKPGPVYDNRHYLAIFDRDKLIDNIENKVLVRVTDAQFRIDPHRFPVIGFSMAPVSLPAEGADLRDSDKNDACFYLIVSFDTERHDIGGYDIPKSIGYVWANTRWEQPVGKDPDYDAFLRYIPIGWGNENIGEIRNIRRNIIDDFLKAYPEHDQVPDIIEIFLKIDSNTMGGTAESAVEKVWFEIDGNTRQGG